MAKHEYYVVQGKTLNNIAETMKTVLGVDKDTPIRFDEITNNEKAEQVTENVDAQAEVIEQIKTVLNGKSSVGVKEIVDIIDQSGVLGTTDETVIVTEKVEQLIDKAEDENIWYFISEKFTNNFPSFENTSFESLPRMNPVNVTSLGYRFQRMPNLKRVDFYINAGKTTSYNSTFMQCTALEYVKGCNTSSATNVNDMFSGCGSLKTIEKPFDLSSVGTNNAMFRGNVIIPLEYVRFANNCIHNSFYMGKCTELSAESVQSIFDGLDPTATGQTLTLPSQFNKAEAEAVVSANIEVVDGVTQIKGKEGWTLVR